MATDLAELRLHTRGARRIGRFEPREDRHVRALSDGRMALLKEQLDHLAGRDQDDKDDDNIRLSAPACCNCESASWTSASCTIHRRSPVKLLCRGTHTGVASRCGQRFE